MTPSAMEERLKEIFAAILELPAAEVSVELTPQTCAKWDSLSQIHLINGIEEEFGFEMDFQDQLRLLSFATALEIVKASAV